jgi:hypothetical protein
MFKRNGIIKKMNSIQLDRILEGQKEKLNTVRIEFEFTGAFGIDMDFLADLIKLGKNVIIQIEEE